MGRVHDGIDERLRDWIAAQHVFFVGTAPREGGHVNVSPKGFAGSFAVLGPRAFAYLDRTGSGVETIAHLEENGRIVVMLCAFEGPPRVVRLHGTGRVVLPGSEGFDALRAEFPPGDDRGLRSIIHVEVERVSDSCGFGVPLMTYDGDRDTMARWVAGKTDEQLVAYRAEKNATSIDGLPGLPGIPDLPGLP
jgi:hypothetical protein